MSGVKGKSGRKKKTDAEKLILGAKKDRIAGDNCPAVISDGTIVFKWQTELGLQIIDLFEPMLHNNGTLSTADSVMFNLLADCYSRWYEARQKCDTQGRYIAKQGITKEGDVVIIDTVIAPWAKLEAQYLDQLTKQCREFGLSPVSRASVEKIARGEKVNPFKGIT